MLTRSPVGWLCKLSSHGQSQVTSVIISKLYGLAECYNACHLEAEHDNGCVRRQQWGSVLDSSGTTI